MWMHQKCSVDATYKTSVRRRRSIPTSKIPKTRIRKEKPCRKVCI